MSKRRKRKVRLWLHRPKHRTTVNSGRERPTRNGNTPNRTNTQHQKRSRTPTTTPRRKKQLISTPKESRKRLFSTPQNVEFDDITEELISEEEREFIDLASDSYVVEQLKQYQILEYMISFLRLVKNNAYPLRNISLLLWLETIRWFSCRHPSEMWYWKETKSFWRAGYRLFHGKFISFMSGIRGMTDNLKIGESDINFAVPARSSLLDNNVCPIPAVVKPGIIHQTLDAVSSSGVSKINMICLDGKKVTPGLDKEYGDVDMFEFEDNPKLSQKQERRHAEIQKIDQIRQYCPEATDATNISHVSVCVQETVTMLTHRVREGHELQIRQSYGLDKLRERAGPEWKTSKFVFAISGIQAVLYRVREHIAKSLKLIGTLCRVGSQIAGSYDYNEADESRTSLQSNLFSLKENEDQVQPVPTHTTKQRTDIWHTIRESTPVTGSTMHNAVGLRSLKEQKQHFDVHVMHQPRPEFTKEVQERLDHGTRNEPVAVATIVSRFLPLFKPDLCFVEEGCYHIMGHDGIPLVTVSPDGSLREKSLEDGVIVPGKCVAAVEIKCPFPKQYGDHLAYGVPKYYVSQCLSEMKALDVEQLLFVCWTKESTVFLEMKFDEVLWNDIMRVAIELYGCKDPVRPKRLSGCVQSIKSQIDKFCDNNVKLIAELPSVVSVVNDDLTTSDDSPYTWSLPRLAKSESHRLTMDLMIAMTDAKESVETSYQLSRRKANEVMVWVASNKDRFYSSEVPNSVPIAYGLKDYKLSQKALRDACTVVLEECYKRGIKVPLLAFDGQWYQLMVRDAKGRPLTVLQVQKDTWKEATAVKKPKIVDKIKALNMVDLDDLESPTSNIRMERDSGRSGIVVTSTTRAFATIVTNLNKRYWKAQKGLQNDKEAVVDDNGVASDDVILDWVPESVLKAVEESGDRDLLTTISSVTRDINTILKGDNVQRSQDNSEPEASSFDPRDMEDTPEEQQPAEIVLSTTCLDAIISKLSTLKRREKWEGCTSEQARGLLSNADSLKTFTVQELDAIASILAEKGVLSQQRPYKNSWTKDLKVNLLSEITGDGSVMKARTLRQRSPPTLKCLSERILRSKNVPKMILNIAYAQYIYEDNLKTWQAQSPFSSSSVVECIDRKIEWYSQPEICSGTGELLCKCLDSHHLLTNLRIKTSTTGFKDIHPGAWKKVATSHTTHLTPAMVEDLVDKQSNSFARTHFSSEVQEEMITNGDLPEAHLCQIIRDWYEADDEAGIPASVRIARWLKLREYLLDGVDFSKFPPAGQFIKGLSVIAFEGFITGIDSKIQLYSLCGGSYCVRTASSLPAETVVGGIQDLNINNTPSVKACDVPRIMSSLTEIMTYKCNPNRGFGMKTSRCAVYPTFIGDETCITDQTASACSNVTTGIISPRNHFFDTPERRRTKARRKLGAITKNLDAPPKGTQPLRRLYHKCDESKILATRRVGIPCE